MLHVIGLYHYPGASNTPWDPIPYVWVHLAGPLRTQELANFTLELLRADSTMHIGGVEYRAVYRMVVGQARLAWYGLTPEYPPDAGQTTFQEGVK